MFILHAKVQQNDDLRGNEQSINEVFYSWHVNVFHKNKNICVLRCRKDTNMIVLKPQMR